MTLHNSWIAGTAALSVMVAGSAHAQDAATALRIQALEDQVAALSAQIQDLRESTAANLADVRSTATATSVTLTNGRPTFATSDGQFTASLRGVFQLDAAVYSQDRPAPLATDFRRGSFGDAIENERARDLNDGTNFRRARIGIEGKAFGNFEYNFLYDFGGSGNEEAGKISSAWVQYNSKLARLRVGAFAPPTSLEDAASSNSALFSERASVAETVRGLAGGDGRTAAGMFANGDRWNASAAITGNLVTTQTFDEQVGFVARASFVPLKGYDWLVHLGANANVIVDPALTSPDFGAGSPSPVRLRDRPELRVDGTRLVDTGNIDSSGVQSYGLEFGAQRKNLYLQAEYFDINVDRRNSVLDNPDFNGWYIQGGWTITGEPRRYTTANAGFDGPRPAKPFNPAAGQWGAVELGLRYSVLDLNYQQGAKGTAPTASAVRGGEQDIFSAGLNWYLNTTVSVQAAYRAVSVDRLSPGGSAFVAGSTPASGTQVGQDLQIWSLRTQYAF